MVAQQGAVSWPGNTAISGSLAELVDAQIGAIPRDVCDVVDLVAISEPVDWECLRLVAGPDAIEEAEQRELIRTASGEVYVGHPLYAEVRAGPTARVGHPGAGIPAVRPGARACSASAASAASAATAAPAAAVLKTAPTVNVALTARDARLLRGRLWSVE